MANPQPRTSSFTRQHVITAVVTDDSIKRLGVASGQSWTAVFKASSVFLVSVD